MFSKVLLPPPVTEGQQSRQASLAGPSAPGFTDQGAEHREVRPSALGHTAGDCGGGRVGGGCPLSVSPALWSLSVVCGVDRRAKVQTRLGVGLSLPMRTGWALQGVSTQGSDSPVSPGPLSRPRLCDMNLSREQSLLQ